MAENSLEGYHLSILPPTVHYIPDFITDSEEEQLMKSIYQAPKPKWTDLSNRRLQNWGGIPHEKGMLLESMPSWLEVFCEKVSAVGVFGDSNKPNHVLVNEYLPGQGIMPHTDGPMYYPVVANITLASHGVLELYRAIGKESDGSKSGVSTSLEDRHFGSIFLERRSLLLVRDDMYSDYLHGICDRYVDIVNDKVANLSLCPGRKLGDSAERSTRVSLTIRNVPKVRKAKFLLGNRK